MVAGGGKIRSADSNEGAPNQQEQHRWGLRSAHPAEERWEWEGIVTSAEFNEAVQVGIEGLTSKADKLGHGGIVGRMK
jgi:hypothetical protein